MRSPSRRRRREPRPHERLWQDRCVDAKLKDEWLICLNLLQVFDLVSICEGHVRQSRRSSPHINLRVKDEYLAVISDEWHTSGRSMSNLIDDMFSQNSNIEIKLEDTFEKRGQRSHYRQKFVARIQCSQGSDLESTPDTFEAWFETIIGEIKVLDKFLHDMCKEFRK